MTTSTENALLQAINDNPADAQSMLVLADLLEEESRPLEARAWRYFSRKGKRPVTVQYLSFSSGAAYPGGVSSGQIGIPHIAPGGQPIVLHSGGVLSSQVFTLHIASGGLVSGAMGPGLEPLPAYTWGAPCGPLDKTTGTGLPDSWHRYLSGSRYSTPLQAFQDAIAAYLIMRQENADWMG